MSLSQVYSWTSTPLIASAPMGGFALHKLACTVSQAGGIGFIGSVDDMSMLEQELQLAKERLHTSNFHTSRETLPIGVGFLLFITDLEAASKVIGKYKPAAVWFFAAKANDNYVTWTKRMREVSPHSKIWIQTGLVSSALEIASMCKPDVLVLQGSDAGGHGYEKGAGIISLVPETISALAEAGLDDVKVFASGGIADGRSVAAALVLGAEGAVIGTRFLASDEIVLPAEGYRDAILKATDGGQSTTRDKLFDNLRGPNIWPEEYDGRSLAVDSYKDFKAGVDIEGIRRLYNEAAATHSKGFDVVGSGKARAAVWAGTGVGFAKKLQSAKEIVEEIKQNASRAMQDAKARI